ncbi:HAMP domain-containing histidine kinase [Clostridiaceae bacterium OttesenSCG-928-D20]|nr:HAMP domain-containing histidine kinase [Clostridiaceae bacterium OttesenSCG-928-D20]
MANKRNYYEPKVVVVKPKKSSSIARAINRSFSRRLFTIYFFMNIVMLHSELYAVFDYLINSSFLLEDFLGLIFILRDKLLEHSLLLIFQLVSWTFSLFWGTGGIRRKLKPLDELSDLAEYYSRQTIIDESRFHNFEEAIESISPLNEQAILKTGDRELSGLEDAINGLIIRMRESYRQQTRFVSDASHELRTPIAVLQGYADMLDRWGKEDEKVLSESIDAIKSEVAHMKRLVEQLLFLARGDAGRTELKISEINLTELVQEVFEESEMIDREHVYKLKENGAVFTNADPDLIKQMARILVENAVKYTDSGEIITLSAEYNDAIPCIVVQDNGKGIAGSEISHVFERFYRADDSRTRDTGGTGLGLSIAKWIVERHGGWFSVLSREEIGTRITVFLPFFPADPIDK